MFFFFINTKHSKVNIKLTFEAPKGENPTLEEFNDFLNGLSNLHEHEKNYKI
jgi:hypothetical protein